MQKTLLASLLVSLSALYGAASAAPEVPIYDGKTLAQDSLSVGNWGGGSAAESTDLFLFGGHSLKVTTLDPYQGARVTLLNPAALAGSGRMFQLTLQRGPVTLHYDPQTVPGAAQTNPQDTTGGGGGRGGRRRGGGGGGFGGPGGGGFGGGQGGFGGPGGGGQGGGFGGGQGGFGGRGGRGGGRYGGRGGQPAPLIPLISNLRFEFTLADGRKADILEPIPTVADTVAGEGWYSVNVPLSALKFGAGGPQMLQSVTVAGDQFGVFYVGRMQLAPNVAPPAEPAKAAPGDDTPDDQFPGGPDNRGEQNSPPEQNFPPGQAAPPDGRQGGPPDGRDGQ